MADLDVNGTVKVSLDVDGRDAKAELQGVSNQAKKTGDSFSALGKSGIALKIGLGASIAVIANEMRKAVEVGARFENTLSKVKAISGATESQFKALSSQAKQLGASTSFTATQVAELQVEYSKFGFVPEEIQKVTEATLNLAKASGEDLATSAEVTAGVVRAYGLEASKAGKVTDVMAKSFTSSALDLQKFKVAIGQSGKIASDAGLSIADTSAILGELANQNIRAETAGVGLKNILLKINEEGSKVGRILGGGVNSLDDLIVRLQSAKQNGDAFKKAQKELGTENSAVFSTLVSVSDKLKEYSTELENSEGQAKKMSDIMSDNLQGDFEKATSALEGLRIAFFEAFKPDARDAVQGVTDVLGDMETIARATGEAVGFLASSISGWSLILKSVTGNDNTFISSLASDESMSKLDEVEKKIKTVSGLIEKSNSKFGSVLYKDSQRESYKKSIEQLEEERKFLLKKIASEIKEASSTSVVQKIEDNKKDSGSTTTTKKVIEEQTILSNAPDLDAMFMQMRLDQNAEFVEKRVEQEREKAERLDQIERVRNAWLDEQQEARTKKEDEESTKREQRAKEEKDAKLRATAMFFSGWSNLATQYAKKNKELAGLAQALAIGEAIVNTYKGATLALASAPPPFGAIGASGVIASGLASVAQIKAQKFATGGVVGGSSYFGDKVPIMVNSGEEILPSYDPRHRNNIGSVSNSSNYNITINMAGNATRTDIRKSVQMLRSELDEMERLRTPSRY